jgi:hypothetical protein
LHPRPGRSSFLMPLLFVSPHSPTDGSNELVQLGQSVLQRRVRHTNPTAPGLRPTAGNEDCKCSELIAGSLLHCNVLTNLPPSSKSKIDPLTQPRRRPLHPLQGVFRSGICKKCEPGCEILSVMNLRHPFKPRPLAAHRTEPFDCEKFGPAEAAPKLLTDSAISVVWNMHFEWDSRRQRQTRGGTGSLSRRPSADDQRLVGNQG